YYFFFSSRRRHTRSKRDWSSDVCSSDLWPTTHSGAGKTRYSAIPTLTAPKVCTSLPAAKPSPPAGLTHRTVASTWASHKTNKEHHDCVTFRYYRGTES